MTSLRYVLREDTEESDPTPDDYGERIWCPYCGGSGDEEWFKTHEHPNPFGDDAE